ncbi:MAG: alpha/beta fold hydrolase [Bacteroidales bacterium]|nr:alpha/beta fold hydrolase [Bacteroidales bacterium]
MKKILLTILSLFAVFFSSQAKEYEIHGPQGGISMKITLPEGFDKESDKCPMVILMHGIFASKGINPIPAIAKGLAHDGIASIRFDFNGHGASEGRRQDMTVPLEIADAIAVLRYVQSLPYVDGIGFLGHSQGGVIASMTAGQLVSQGEKVPDGMILIAPGSVIKDATQGGVFFGVHFDPKDPPEFIRCFGLMKLGREYLLSTQELDIFGTAAHYKGPVRLIHGTVDKIVPMRCSEQYLETYGEEAELIAVEGENHLITKKKKKVVSLVREFFRGIFYGE